MNKNKSQVGKCCGATIIDTEYDVNIHNSHKSFSYKMCSKCHSPQNESGEKCETCGQPKKDCQSVRNGTYESKILSQSPNSGEKEHVTLELNTCKELTCPSTKEDWEPEDWFAILKELRDRCAKTLKLDNNTGKAVDYFLQCNVVPPEAFINAITSTRLAERERVREEIEGITELGTDWTEHAKRTIPAKNLELQTAANKGWNNFRKLVLEKLQDNSNK